MVLRVKRHRRACGGSPTSDDITGVMQYEGGCRSVTCLVRFGVGGVGGGSPIAALLASLDHVTMVRGEVGAGDAPMA
eukprot:scaffold95944_cov33-Tisochrysis_lutea.AAC.3